VSEPASGGCQCGAVRFRADRLGGAAICHCRMCQKAFGGFFGPLVTGDGVVWTRGQPSYFASSNKFRRGFCSACGTPLTYERIGGAADGSVELAIGALDDPGRAPPSRQVNFGSHVPFFADLAALPVRASEDAAWIAAQGIVTRQHPDHDTASWPPPEESLHG